MHGTGGNSTCGNRGGLGFQIFVHSLHLSVPYCFFNAFFFFTVPLSVNAVYILVAGFYAVIRFINIYIYIYYRYIHMNIMRKKYICMWHHHNNVLVACFLL